MKALDWLPIVVVTLLSIACSDYRQPEAAVAPKTSAVSEDVYQALKDLKREIRTLEENIDDKVIRSFERKLAEQTATLADAQQTIVSVSDRLKSVLESLSRQSESMEAMRADTSKLAGIEQHASELTQSLASFKGTLDDLKTTLASVNLEKFFETTRQLAEVTGRAYKAEGERDAAQTMYNAANERIQSLLETIAGLEQRIRELGEASVNAHPDYIALKKKFDTLDNDHAQLKKDFDKMKDLADAQAVEIDNLKSGLPPSVENPGTSESAAPTATYEAGFRAVVKTPSFIEQTKQYVLLCDLKEGTMPKKGDVLVILNEKDEVVCELKVTMTFDAMQFGGETIGAVITNAPTDGDIIRRKRAISAGGVDNE